MKKVKKLIGWILAALVVMINYTAPVKVYRTVPEQLELHLGSSTQLELGGLSQWVSTTGGDDRVIDLGYAADRSNCLTIDSVGCGTAGITFSLFGVIPLKTVDVTVNTRRMLYPSGQAIGVALDMQGVLVVGSTQIATAQDELADPAGDAGLHRGDVILTAQGEKLDDSDDLLEAVQQSGGQPVLLGVLRAGTQLEMGITPARDFQDGEYKLGIWVRDSAAGVGTLTYYDVQTGRFGALGHAITDVDTGDLLSVESGEVFPASIVALKRGYRGVPGELQGTFVINNDALADIDNNTPFGIYGSIRRMEAESLFFDEPLPAASRSEIHLGAAQLLTTLDDNVVQAYNCRVIKLAEQHSAAIKSMVVEVTDERLLERTGGIVQGMSGSPLIQDGRIIGAITHVYISDPTRGQAVYIDWMLENQ